jgi:hypothetical protein
MRDFRLFCDKSRKFRIFICHDGVSYNCSDEQQPSEETSIMNWIYFAKLFRTRFQAGCLAKRLEQDGWIYGYHDPQFVEIYRSRKGRYGVRFLP